MKKSYSFKSAILLALCFVFCMGNISAQVWQQVDITELNATDVFVIVDINSNCAMLNSNGASSAPTATAVSVNEDHLEGDVPENLKWNISGNATDGYIFYPNGTTETWLYCNNSNNGLRVGTNTANLFTTELYTTTNEYFLKHIGTGRYIGVYNSQDWRCYTSVNNNIKNNKTRFFKYVASISSVATPVFTPGAGTYFTEQSVSIACETPDATIFYTTDGTRPNGNSAVYTAPITVSASTIFKAIAVVGSDTSNMATATYTFPVEVATIAELRSQSADNATLYQLTGEAIVSFVGSYRNHKYIDDYTAGILIDDNSGIITSSYVAGDGMTGLVGTLTSYQNMMEFVPVRDPGEATSHGNEIVPFELELDADFEQYEARMVQLSNVTLAPGDTFAHNTDYAIEGAENVNIRLRYNECELIGTPIPSTPQIITALVYQYQSTYNLVAVAMEEYTPAPSECENVPEMGECTATLDNRDMLFTGQIAVDDTLCTLHEYGFVYSATSTLPELNDDLCTTVVLGNSIEAGTEFSYRLAELGYDTYYVRAFATNEVGTGYSEVASVQQSEPEEYTVNFVVNDLAESAMAPTLYFREGQDPLELPVIDGCKNLAFAGWTLQPFEGQTTVRPEMVSTFVPVSDTTFYAVFTVMQDLTLDEIVITRSSFEEGALAYNTDDEWNVVSRMNGTAIQGFADLYSQNNTTYMQMRTERGSLPYNVTALPGHIIYIAMYSANTGSTTATRDWTPWLSTTPVTSEVYQTGVQLETQNLEVGSLVEWYVDASLNASYFYLDLTGSTSYIDSIVVAYEIGDAIYTMSTLDTVIIDQTICEGMVYEDEYFQTSEEGTYMYLETVGDYCATQYILNLSLESRDTLRHYVDTCDSYTLDGQPYTSSEQVFIVTPVEDFYGCPIVDEWNITIRNSSESEFAIDTCDFYAWNETVYTQSGDYQQIFINAEGCDSTVTLHLSLHLSDTVEITENICSGQLPYTYTNGQITTTFGIETPEFSTSIYALSTADGCDSIVIFNLTVNPEPVSYDTIVNCGSYVWNGTTYAESGDYEMVFPLTTGCDSTAYLHLTVNHGNYTEQSVDTCATSYVWEVSGDSYDHSGTYYYYSDNVNACQDTAVLLLSLHSAAITEISAQICEGETYHQNGFNVTEEGDYQQVLQTVDGCDSTIILHLTVGSEAVTNITGSICIGSDYTENGFDIQAPEAGVHSYSRVIERPGTCDSVVVLTLTVNEPSYGDTTAVACGSFEWHGTTYSESGDYTTVLTNAAGCDSTVTLHLTINEATEGDTAAVACGSFEWHGTTYSESGDYTTVLTNAAGCDSTVTLHLTINEATEGDTAAVACGSFEWHGTTYSESGDYTDVLINAAGCDSTVTLHLTINEATEGDTTAVACGSFEWYGTTYSESGDYTTVLTNAAGCDSTVTLHLTINAATEGDTAAVACGSFEWHGTTYSESGDYTDVLINAAGCDSTVTLHLTINEATEGDTAAVACGSFEWHGTTYSESGDYTTVLTNAAGCDSTVTLHLTINEATEGDTTAVACGSFEWHGTTYSESGDYTTVLTNAAGCDSTVTLHLTINEATEGDTTAVACGSFDWHGTTYSESGDYTDVLINAAGCDSTVTLHLTVIIIDLEIGETNGVISVSQEDAEYQWINCEDNTPIEGATGQQFQPETTGSYACVITMGECTDTTNCVEVTVSGITDNAGVEMRLYPNPTNASVTLQLSPEICALNPEIQLYDVYGRRLQIVPVAGENTEIDLSQYATGVYFVKLVNESRVISVSKVVRR